MAYEHAVEHRQSGDDERSGRSSFIGSFPDDDGPGQGVIVLRGAIDAATLSRLRVHIDGLLAIGTRFLVLEAGAVDCYDVGLLELLATPSTG